MQKGPRTPKGFRDIEPDLAAKRTRTISTISQVVENYGFSPLETPTVEFAETLLGKYGEEEKLIYTFTDRGGRELALRYDFTVPLARYIANNYGSLKLPFARYQTGQVFRGEKPQAGRYREFTQFDFDIVGSNEISNDAKVLAAAISATRKLGLKKAKIAVNDRKNFENVPVDFVRAIDKYYKIGLDGIVKELIDKGYSDKEIKVVKDINNAKPTEDIIKLFQIIESDYNLKEDKDFFFDPTLARGLDYYTGAIFELKPDGHPEDQSAGSGGRYDNLIGKFLHGKQVPAVGFSFGIDRITELA